MGIFLIASKPSDVRRRGATTEAYGVIRRKEKRTPALLGREGNAADDALMVNQGDTYRLDFKGTVRYCPRQATFILFRSGIFAVKTFFLPLALCSALIALFMTSGIDKAWAEEDSPSDPLIWVLKAYQEHISPVDGGRCPSVPTCSSYSLEAFRKHGFFMGWMMTVDRLIHEGKEEAAVSPLLFSEGEWRLYDPVENNDFWWSPPDRAKND